MNYLSKRNTFIHTVQIHNLSSTNILFVHYKYSIHPVHIHYSSSTNTFSGGTNTLSVQYKHIILPVKNHNFTSALAIQQLLILQSGRHSQNKHRVAPLVTHPPPANSSPMKNVPRCWPPTKHYHLNLNKICKLYKLLNIEYTSNLSANVLYGYGILALDRQVAGSSPTDGVWSL